MRRTTSLLLAAFALILLHMDNNVRTQMLIDFLSCSKSTRPVEYLMYTISVYIHLFIERLPHDIDSLVEICEYANIGILC